MAVAFMITTAGLDALVDAQNAVTGPLQIAEIGVTGQTFLMAPTITALPNEIKRISAIAGHVVDAFTISMTARDASNGNFSVSGLGLYLANGTLFAVWSAATGADPLFIKSAQSHFLTSFVITFTSNVGAALTFADSSFDFQPATETGAGIVERATVAEALARADATRYISPATLDAVLDVVQGFTVTGAGLATGGGDGTANQQITVPAASGAETIALSLATKAVTPQGLGQAITFTGTATSWTMNILGLLVIKYFRSTVNGNSSNSFTFAGAFPNNCFDVWPSMHTATHPDQQDNETTVDKSTITVTGFSTFTAFDAGGACGFLALGN